MKDNEPKKNVLLLIKGVLAIATLAALASCADPTPVVIHLTVPPTRTPTESPTPTNTPTPTETPLPTTTPTPNPYETSKYHRWLQRQGFISKYKGPNPPGLDMDNCPIRQQNPGNPCTLMYNNEVWIDSGLWGAYGHHPIFWWADWESYERSYTVSQDKRWEKGVPTKPSPEELEK